MGDLEGAKVYFEESLVLNKTVARELRQRINRGSIRDEEPGGNSTASHINLSLILRECGNLIDALYHAQNAVACTTDPETHWQVML